MKKSCHYLEQGRLSRIAYISAKQLLEASYSDEQQRYLRGLDMIIPADTSSLKAAGHISRARLREVEENIYLKELLRVLARGQLTVFLLAEDEEALALLEKGLRLMQHNLCVAGRGATAHYEGNRDSLVNTINASVSRAILSRLPYPEGIRMMEECRPYLNSSLWLMLPEALPADGQKSRKGGISGWLLQERLRRRMRR